MGIVTIQNLVSKERFYERSHSDASVVSLLFFWNPSPLLVMIESFMVINDGSNTSFYLQSSNRSLKFQCTNDYTHQEWLLSLKHLLIDTPSVKKEDKQHQVGYRRLGKLLKTHPPSMRQCSLRPDALSSKCTSRHSDASHPASFVSFPSMTKRIHVPVKLAY